MKKMAIFVLVFLTALAITDADKLTDCKAKDARSARTTARTTPIHRTDTRTENDTPLVVISFSGFRKDYLDRSNFTTLKQFMADGVTAPYMIPSYPPHTFPDSYTLVTGVYPESHGIISFVFNDPNLGFFIHTAPSAKKGGFWKATAIWNNIKQQGKKSATMFWPGSDVDAPPPEGGNPTYWFPYDASTPNTDRVEQIVQWLTLTNETDRPVFVCAYFRPPDFEGHNFGPDSQQVTDSLAVVDSLLKLLLDRLKEEDIEKKVNIIVLSDQGMADAGIEKNLHLDDYLPDVDDQGFFYFGSQARLRIYEPYLDLKEQMKQNTSCKSDFMRQYCKTELPKRLHYSNDENIQDLHFQLDPGYSLYSQNIFNSSDRQGFHGYDNLFPDMQTIMAASGPDFKKGKVVEPFQNIELYNLMCHLVGVTPSPNNGSHGSITDMLKTPSMYTLPSVDEKPLPCPEEFPNNTLLDERLDDSGCPGDLTDIELWLYELNLPETEMLAALDKHFPWSLQYQSGELSATIFFDEIPSNVLGEDLILLVQKDHVIGYSPSMKQALWTSFTLDTLPAGTTLADWSSDPRLATGEGITCDAYNTPALTSQGITMNPLFPPQFSQNSSLDQIPYLVSNAVPMTEKLASRMQELNDIVAVQHQAQPDRPINVVIGLIFDNNTDSYPDETDYYGALPNVPSDLFMVVTSCNDTETDLAKCKQEFLEVKAYIYHQHHEIDNCLSDEDYAAEFGARVRDVEIATDLFFYPMLKYEDKIKIATRIPLKE